jgi:hypothetical protein
MSTKLSDKSEPTTAPEARVHKGRPVIVCTAHKGIFFGYAEDTTGDCIFLTGGRMAIYWATTRGLFELAEVGPNTSSKISARADFEARAITGVLEVTAEAVKKWEAAR